LDAHGGIKFSEKCADTSQEAWTQWRVELLSRQDEAKQYPRGEAAVLLEEWREGLESYDAWKLRMQQVRVCHVAGDGETDDVWWFGFDCADVGDLCPEMSTWGVRKLRALLDETYKDVGYVKAECTKLARQLQAVDVMHRSGNMGDP
jgi:hypothetical protein